MKNPSEFGGMVYEAEIESNVSKTGPYVNHLISFYLVFCFEDLLKMINIVII